MQKTKIAAEELAEMIRDGLAEEGHDVQVHPNLKPAGTWRSSPQMRPRTPDQERKPSRSGFANGTTWRRNIKRASAASCFAVADRHRDRLPGGECLGDFRSCGRPICSAEWEVKSSRACCRIRRGKTPSSWQSGCVPHSKPPITRRLIETAENSLWRWRPASSSCSLPSLAPNRRRGRCRRACCG